MATKKVGDMTLKDLLELSDELGSVRRWDIGAAVSAIGAGLIGAAVGMGEKITGGTPSTYVALGGAGAFFVGFMWSRERTIQISRIKRRLDFDIDSWCDKNPEAAEHRGRFRAKMKVRSPWERLLKKVGWATNEEAVKPDD